MANISRLKQTRSKMRSVGKIASHKSMAIIA